MDKKIVATLVVLLFCAGCLGIVSAENNTNETAQSNVGSDMSGHIQPISITDKGIEFSDGFTGFCLDSTKDPITTADGFARQNTNSDEIQNYVKLAIIEAYKQGCENNLAQIIASFVDGSYKNSNDKVIASVLKSQATAGDNATVELEDSIEGTFEFELLKDVNGKKSDCLAYKVSLKEVQNNDKLTAPAENNATADNNGTDDNGNTTNSTDNKTNDRQDGKKTENKTADNKQETIVDETNKTIVNKTNTVIVNEKNTTIINQNNTKVINKTNDTPQNATIPNKILRTVGNPIFLLIVVIVIAAVVVVVMRRKGQ